MPTARARRLWSWRFTHDWSLGTEMSCFLFLFLEHNSAQPFWGDMNLHESLIFGISIAMF